MTFTVRYVCAGRLGNCAFPYALCMLYQIFFGYTYINQPNSNEMVINDSNFFNFFSEHTIQTGFLPKIPSNIVFSGYFQHDFIFKYFINRFRLFLNINPTQVLHTGTYEKIFSEILTKDTMPSLTLSPTTVVVHLRMEDKVAEIIEPNSPHFVIHPDDYESVLKQIKYDRIIWIMNEPKTDIEKKYLQYLQYKYGGEYTIQSLADDMTIMRKAHTLVCSRSTLSWICSAFAYQSQKVFMPEKYENWPHETFQSIHSETSYFSYRKACRHDLETVCSLIQQN